MTSLQGDQEPDESCNPEAQDRLSFCLASLDTGHECTIGEVVDTLGGRGFGATMLVFAVPNLVPNPPGTSPILGLPLLLLAVQLLIGRETVWLPEWLRRRPVSRHFLTVLAQRIAPVVSRLEKALKPRLGSIATSAVTLRAIGAVALPLAAILLLPLPFLHMLPGAAMTALAAGLAERDGYAIIAGYALALITLVVFFFLGGTLYSGITSLLGQAAT